jgi:hypothetical protein
MAPGRKPYSGAIAPNTFLTLPRLFRIASFSLAGDRRANRRDGDRFSLPSARPARFPSLAACLLDSRFRFPSSATARPLPALRLPARSSAAARPPVVGRAPGRCVSPRAEAPPAPSPNSGGRPAGSMVSCWQHARIVGRDTHLSVRMIWGERRTVCEGETRSSTMVNILWCFKICACTFGCLAARKNVHFLQFPLSKFEVLVPYYFGTGPTLLWYHGTVWYHQFGTVYFITVRSG